MESNFNYKFNQNNNPDIGRLIDESFNIFKKTVWVMGIGMILLSILGMIISGGIITTVTDISSIKDFIKSSPTLQYDTTYQLVNTGVSILLAGILAPFTAGFYKINHLADTDKDFSFNNFFDYYSSTYLKDLMIYGILVAIITNVFGVGLVYLDFPIIAVIVQLFLGFLFIFGIPLIIFENQNATEAISNSAKIAFKHPLTIILSLLFAFLIALLGIFAICIGLFFTVGYIYTMNYVLYDAIIPIENVNPLDEIGLE